MKTTSNIGATLAFVTAVLTYLGTAHGQDKVCFQANQGTLGAPSYFDATLQTPIGPMIYDAWCVVTDLQFKENTTYTGAVFEPGDPAIASLIDYPENLDLVVYILNQKYPRTPSPSGLGTYTYGDVQLAIWTLVDENTSVSGLGSYKEERVNEIVTDARMYGEGFVPECGQITIQFINPVQLGCHPDTALTIPIAQILIIEVLVDCPTNPGTGTPGYWKNHPEAWPVDAIVMGGITFTKQQAIAMLKAPVRQDKRVTLFASLVCAKLNVLIGNDSSCIQTTIDAADAWWARYARNQVRANSTAWRLGEPLHRELDAYNNGLLCAPHRD